MHHASSSSHLVDDSRCANDRITGTSTIDGDDVVDVVRASVGERDEGVVVEER